MARYKYTIRLRNEEGFEKVEGTKADEPTGPGSLTVYDGDDVAARYMEGIESWARVKINPED